MDEVLYFCINLDRSPDRRDLMQAEAKRAGIELSFIRAIDGTYLSLDSAPGYDRKSRLKYGPDLKPNEVACALSHRAALEAFLASGANAAVVFEDDAVISDRFAACVRAIVDLPVRWDAVNLENRNKKPLRPALVHFSFGVSLNASGWLSKGAGCWLYSRRGAERTLRSLFSFRHGFDTHMGYFWQHGLTALCVHPPVVSASSGLPSTIFAPGHPEREFTWKALSLRQALRWRRDRITHEIRKEIAARIIYARLKLELIRARRQGTVPVRSDAKEHQRQPVEHSQRSSSR